MAEHNILKLDPDSHLLLEQPLLRLPHELLKKNLKSAQRAIEPLNKNVTAAVQTAAKQSPAEALASLDATLQKAQNLKRKLEALHAEEQALHSQQKARIDHLQTLHEIPSLGDVAYDRWSHVRLDRLLVDYLLRQGLTQSAKELSEENKLGGLVDVGVFEEAGRIEQALRRGEVKEALSWCGENKNALKKMNVCTNPDIGEKGILTWHDRASLSLSCGCNNSSSWRAAVTLISLWMPSCTLGSTWQQSKAPSLAYELAA